MLRYALVALLAVVVSDMALADFQEVDFSFTAKVASASGNILTDPIGRTFDLVPPPYTTFSGEGSYLVSGDDVLSFDLQTIVPSGETYPDVNFQTFYSGLPIGHLLDPTNPGAGIEGGPSFAGDGSRADFGTQSFYGSPYDEITDIGYSLQPGADGAGNLALTLKHHSLEFGDRYYNVNIDLLSVTMVPEPSSLLLTALGFGALVLPLASRRRRRTVLRAGEE